MILIWSLIVAAGPVLTWGNGLTLLSLRAVALPQGFLTRLVHRRGGFAGQLMTATGLEAGPTASLHPAGALTQPPALTGHPGTLTRPRSSTKPSQVRSGNCCCQCCAHIQKFLASQGFDLAHLDLDTNFSQK